MIDLKMHKTLCNIIDLAYDLRDDVKKNKDLDPKTFYEMIKNVDKVSSQIIFQGDNNIELLEGE